MTTAVLIKDSNNMVSKNILLSNEQLDNQH